VRRAERVTVFCFRLFRSLVPRSEKSKTKMGWKHAGTLENQLCCLFRFGQIPNHESPFTDFSPILADEINRGAGITIH